MVCISLTSKKLEELLKDLKDNEKKADLTEIRLDFQDNLSMENLKIVVDQVMANKTKPVIFTVRSKKEGGNYPNKFEEQVEILLYAVEKGADYIDIELDWTNKIYKKIFKNKKQAKVIASYHNFKNTPTIYGLKKIARRLAWTKADILKIATMTNSYVDNQNLFLTISFIINRYKLPAICLGMGEKGLISRVMQKEMGGYLTFLCSDVTTESAPGQITLEEYFKIRKDLKLN